MTPWQLRQAVGTLRAGGIIAYPTETVFGLGCDPLNFSAIEDLLTLKQRPIKKGLILIGAQLEHLLPYIDIADAELLNKLTTTTLRPTTWVVPAHKRTPVWLTGQHSSIAVRLTSHPIAAELCTMFDSAIVSTSANPAGHPPARTSLSVNRYFHGRLNYLLHSASKLDNKPSQIRDLLSNKVFRSV